MMPTPQLPTALMPRRTLRCMCQSALLAIAAAASVPAVAAQAHASDGGTARASAALDFRIVVPEAVRFVYGQEQRDLTRQHTSRTVEVVEGRRVTTVARP